MAKDSASQDPQSAGKPGGVITDSMREKARRMAQDPKNQCGAPSKTSPTGKCRNWAGARTNHKGTGYCWLHDRANQPERARPVDLVVLNSQYSGDPEILELAGEIDMIREKIQEVSTDPDADLQVLVKLTDNLRKLISTKNTIELQRRYLIPVSVVENVARRLTEIIAKRLPPEQRLALRDEVVAALRVELSLSNDGQWSDPGANWAQRQLKA